MCTIRISPYLSIVNISVGRRRLRCFSPHLPPHSWSLIKSIISWWTSKHANLVMFNKWLNAFYKYKITWTFSIIKISKKHFLFVFDPKALWSYLWFEYKVVDHDGGKRIFFFFLKGAGGGGLTKCHTLEAKIPTHEHKNWWCAMTTLPQLNFAFLPIPVYL